MYLNKNQIKELDIRVNQEIHKRLRRWIIISGVIGCVIGLSYPLY